MNEMVMGDDISLQEERLQELYYVRREDGKYLTLDQISDIMGMSKQCLARRITVMRGEGRLAPRDHRSVA